MPKLPVLSGKKLLKLLTNNLGIRLVGNKGSHVRVKRVLNEEVLISVIPLHDELAKGTLRSILRQLKIKRDELIDLL